MVAPLGAAAAQVQLVHCEGGRLLYGRQVNRGKLFGKTLDGGRSEVVDLKSIIWCDTVQGQT
jgi:hypothetical protein